MNCFFCKEEMLDYKTIYTTKLSNGCIVIIKNVPCKRCNCCGEIWYDGNVAEKLDEIIDTLENTLTEIAIVNFSDKVA